MKKSFAIAFAGLLACAGLATAQTFDCATYGTGCNNAIPAAGTAGDMNPSVISVPGAEACQGRDVIVDVDVLVDYNHTFNGDLSVRLTSLDADGADKTVTLWSNLGGSDNNMCVTIDDQAETPMTGTVLDCSARTSGNRLCAFNGASGAGDWQLDINDNAGGDSGALNAWAVTIACETSRDSGCSDAGGRKGGRGLGSWANNGRGNGDDLPPPGQRGR